MSIIWLVLDLILFHCFIEFIVSEVYTFPLSERLALLDFYTQTNGSYWTWYINQEIYGIPWDFSDQTVNPCLDRWQGIECSCYYRYEILHDNYNPGKNDSLFTHPNSLIPNISQEGYLPYGYYGFYYDDASPYSLEEVQESDPNEIIDCTINKLHLINYNLHGTIPSSLLSLKNVTHLQLDWNYLTGPMFSHDFLSTLTKLKVLSLLGNQLTGNLPSKLFTYNQITKLSLGFNYLNGTIPNDLILPQKIENFDVSYNFLSGTISNSFFSNCNQLKRISFQKNYFTGLLPSSTANCQQLKIMCFTENSFSGSIPLEFLNLHHLTFFQVAYNQLTGPNLIAESILAFPNMTTFEIETNHLTGSIPNSINESIYLEFFNIARNRLTGSIPEEIYDLKHIYFLSLDRNFFTGTLSSNIYHLSSTLSHLFTGYNLFTGTIPQEFNTLTLLNGLNMSGNLLSGPVPTLANCSALKYFSLDSNHFSGTIPTSYFFLSGINDLFLQYNYFTGSLFSDLNKFDVNTTGILMNIDISHNFLEERFPSQLFTRNSDTLRTLVASSNCFDGIIDHSICDVKQLYVLILNGMNTACSRYRTALNLNNPGHIPACILQMQSIRSLYLSGIGFTGHLPQNVSDKLHQISLSYNQITGSIPSSYQQRNWTLFDLSYNKLSGTLQPNIETNEKTTKLVLIRNRLSGILPEKNLKFVKQINILNGNLFTCNFEGNSLPKHDPHAKIYSCGTNILNLQLYIVISLLGASIIMAIWFRQKFIIQRFQFDYPTYTKSISITQFLFALIRFRIYLMLFGLCSTVYFMSVYIILGHYYSSYTYKYAYVISSAYLTGSVPGVILLISWSICLLCFSWGVNSVLHQRTLLKIDSDDFSSHNFPTLDGVVAFLRAQSSSLSFAKFDVIEKISFYFIVFLSSFVLMILSLGINAGFVYTQTKYTSFIRYLCQIAMASLKLLYARVLIPFIFKIINLIFDSHKKRKYFEDHIQIHLESMIAIFSNVVSPFITTGLVDINCLYNRVFDYKPMLTADYEYNVCDTWVGSVCIAETTFQGTAMYTPRFQYSYQCSSSIVANYISVYVFLLLIDSFFKPTIVFILRSRILFNNPQGNNMMGYASKEPSIINNNINNTNNNDMQNMVQVIPSDNFQPSHPPTLSLPNKKELHPFIKQLSTMKSLQHTTKRMPKLHSIRLRPREFIIHFTIYFSLLISFGLMFPPIVMMICYNSNNYLTMLIENIKDTMDYLENFEPITHADEVKLVLVLKLSERKIKSIIEEIIFILNYTSIPFAIFFASWFVWDMFGDHWHYFPSRIMGVVLGFYFIVNGLHILIYYLYGRCKYRPLIHWLCSSEIIGSQKIHSVHPINESEPILHEDKAQSSCSLDIDSSELLNQNTVQDSDLIDCTPTAKVDEEETSISNSREKLANKPPKFEELAHSPESSLSFIHLPPPTILSSSHMPSSKELTPRKASLKFKNSSSYLDSEGNSKKEKHHVAFNIPNLEVQVISDIETGDGNNNNNNNMSEGISTSPTSIVNRQLRPGGKATEDRRGAVVGEELAIRNQVALDALKEEEELRKLEQMEEIENAAGDILGTLLDLVILI